MSRRRPSSNRSSAIWRRSASRTTSLRVRPSRRHRRSSSRWSLESRRMVTALMYDTVIHDRGGGKGCVAALWHEGPCGGTPSYRTGAEAIVTDFHKLLDAVAVRAAWKPGEIRSKMFRHTYCAARLQTLDQGAPVSVYTV